MIPAILLLLVAGAEIRVEGPEARVPWFENRVTEILSEVEGALGMHYEGPIRVRLARTEKEFREWAGDLPDWVVAIAVPADRTIVVRLPAVDSRRGEDVASVLRHEMVHLLRPARTGYRPVPWWFEEGLAQVLGGRINRINLDLLPVTAKTGRLLPLDSLPEGIGESGSAASLAYAEGESMVTFLVDRYGRDGLLRLLDAIRDTGSFPAAIRAVTGRGLPGLEAEWKSWLVRDSEPWFVTLLLPVFLPFLLFVASLLVVVAALRAKRRGHETYESLPD